MFHRNEGMRIDLLYATEPVAKRVVWAEIDREARKGPPTPSDHAPVLVDLDEPGKRVRRRLGGRPPADRGADEATPLGRPRDSRRSGILRGPSPVTVRAAARTWRSRVPQGRTGRRAPRSGRVTSGPMATAPRAATPEIRLDNLEKRFGDVLAVDHVSLDVAAGEFFSLLGPSGCGKTTTLRMIGGFELPTGGRILLRDRDMTREPPDKRPVNMVFQHYALFPHLSVGDNVAFGPKRKGMAKDEVRRRVGEALALVRLDGYEKRKPNQLSGGQQQRVALARALANRPDVLLLDEPLGALDLKLRRQLQVELKRIQQEVGITFIYVTHDQEEALTMSDRIAVMNAGHVEQLGTPEELYERPATRFVADFIGTTNLLRATVDADGRARLETGRAGGRRPRRPRAWHQHRDQRPARVDPAAAGGRRRRHPGPRRAGRLPRHQRLVLSSGRRAGPASRSSPRRPGSASRSAATSPSRGTPPMPSCSAAAPPRRPHWRRSRDRASATTARRSTSSARSCATWRSGGSAGATCWSGSRSSAAPRPSPRSSRRARAPTARRRRRPRTRPPLPARPRRRPRAGRPPAPRRAHRPGPTPEPTAPPTPEGELFIYNWAQYMGKSVIPSFEKKYGVKVTYDFFDNYDTMLAKIGQGGGGYDITFPTSTDIPGLLSAGPDPAARPVAACRTSATSARSGRTRATTRATPTRSRTCGGRPASPTTPPRCRRS